MVTRIKKRKLDEIAGGCTRGKKAPHEEEEGPWVCTVRIPGERDSPWEPQREENGQEDQGPGNPFQEVQESQVPWTHREKELSQE